MAGATTKARARTAIVAAAAAVVGALVLGWFALSPLLRHSLESSKADEPINPAQLAPAPGSPLSAKPASRAGTTREVDGAALVTTTLVARDVVGKPCPDVFVEVLDDRGEWDAAPVVASGTTNADGHLVVKTPPGPLRARSKSATWQSVVAQFTAPVATQVVLRMEPGIPLRVLVTDRDGKPLAGAAVSLNEFGQGITTLTDAEGIADVGAVHGTWEGLTIRKAGFLKRFEWATSAWKRGAAPLRVKLVRAGPLTVRVVRAGDGAPEPRASLWVDYGWDREDGVADEAGVARWDAGAAPPSVLVRATTPDGRRGETTVDVADLSPKEVTIAVKAGRTVSGVAVRATDRTPFSGAVVFHCVDGIHWLEAARTDAAGRFLIERDPRPSGDPVEIRVRAPGWASPNDDAEAPAPPRPAGAPKADGEDDAPDPRSPDERDRSLVVVLSRTSPVVGRVVGKDDKPVANAHVEVSSPDSAPLALHPLESTTDADGRYRIDDLPPWEHLAVIARADGHGVQETDDSLPDPKDGVISVPDLVMPGTFTLDVPVIDEGGRPVPVAWLIISQRVRTQGQMQWRRTVTDGRFHPLEGLSRDGVGIELTAPGFLPDQLPAGPKTDRIVVSRAHRVRGRLVRADGTPLPAGLDVSLDAKDKLCTLEGNCARTKTEADGRCEAGGIRTGRYAVSVKEGDAYLVGLLTFADDGQDVGDVAVSSGGR